jgi:NAD(P)H-hydrate epimerase
MASVTISGMLDAEADALSSGWTEERLLDLAGERLGSAIGRFFPHPGSVVGYLGKGHNAGDTLVALKILRNHFSWNIAVRTAFPIEECAPLTRQKWQQLELDSLLTQLPAWRYTEGPLLLLDGLLGTGSHGALRNPLLALAEEMNWLRNHAGARIAAIDLPSGIDADSGEIFPSTVTADVTFMIANAKRGLLTAHAAHATGALALVPVEPLISKNLSDMELISPQTMDFAKQPRPFDFHKGMAGRVAIIAGSPQYTGAAVLATLGALRGGAGLITLHVPNPSVSFIAAKCPPEIIVRGFSSLGELRNLAADAQVVGCGIGDLDTTVGEALIDWIANTQIPTVVDADALNLIAKSGRRDVLTSHHVLTPHPGEFQRLAPELSTLAREAAARAFADQTPSTLLLKGCRTLVTRADHPLWCNSTGTPGMATGGQGDLLAGVIGARLALGNPPLEAASLAAWLCGRSAEIALDQPEISEESLTPSDVANHLGSAYSDWKSSRR